MEELLCAGEDFEFFLEGGRSRSGKTAYPKGGLLSIIVDSYIEGKIKDALIVPVSISYDKLLDGNFNQEQMGDTKSAESFWRACVAIWKVFMAKFGSVRADFCQPFCLKEYLQVAQCFPQLPSSSSSSQLSLDERVEDTIGPNGVRVMQMVPSPRGIDQSFYGTEIVVEDMRTAIQGLADHVMFNQANAQAIMSTHLLSFLMLNTHRKGASKEEIIKTFDSLKVEISNKKRDTGFIGETGDVIDYASKLLNNVIVRTSKVCDDGSTQVILTPVISLPRVFELTYYANSVTTVFVMDSLMANAIYSLIEREQWVSDSSEQAVIVTHQAIIQRAIFLAQLLKYEFILKPPCADWDTLLNESIEDFLASDILTREEDEEGGGASNKNRYLSLAKSLSCNDDLSDDDSEFDARYVFQKSNQDSMQRFWFLKDVLAPIIECYHITACNLVLLSDQQYTESEFTETVHSILKQRSLSGIARYVESAALDTLKNCLRVLEQQKVVDFYRLPTRLR